jgi:hypothetical protein
MRYSSQLLQTVTTKSLVAKIADVVDLLAMISQEMSTMPCSLQRKSIPNILTLENSSTNIVNYFSAPSPDKSIIGVLLSAKLVKLFAQ